VSEDVADGFENLRVVPMEPGGSIQRRMDYHYKSQPATGFDVEKILAELRALRAEVAEIKAKIGNYPRRPSWWRAPLPPRRLVALGRVCIMANVARPWGPNDALRTPRTGGATNDGER
jgi:hypothetical protein